VGRETWDVERETWDVKRGEWTWEEDGRLWTLDQRLQTAVCGLKAERSYPLRHNRITNIQPIKGRKKPRGGKAPFRGTHPPSIIRLQKPLPYRPKENIEPINLYLALFVPGEDCSSCMFQFDPGRMQCLYFPLAGFGIRKIITNLYKLIWFTCFP